MKRTILYLILLFSALAVSGQPLYFDRIDTRYGLSQNTVNEIIQDSRGFMWFGTKDGLNRYDGTHFKIIRYVPLSKGRTGESTSEPMPAFLYMTQKRTDSVK